MAIDMLHTTAIPVMPDQGYGILNKTAVADIAAKDQSAHAQPSVDNVSFTSQAKELALASKVAHSSDGINTARVAELKQQIDNGTYKVDAESTAAHIMAAEEEMPFIFA